MPEKRRPRKSWRNAILGTLLVLTGLSAALLTLFARAQQNATLTTVAAVFALFIVLLIIILVIPPLARSARREARRVDLPLELTTGGMIVFGILTVLGFAAWNTGNNLLFLVFAVLVSSLFVSWSAGRASLRNLSISARFPDHIFAGDDAPVIVTVTNEKRILPSMSVLIEALLPVERERRRWIRNLRRRFNRRTLAYFAYLPRNSTVEQRVEQKFGERGHLMITGFELSTRFPFGFFRMRRRLRTREVDIIVYPALQPVDDELHLLPMNAGRVAASRKGFGHDLLSLRDYQPQDDLRHIDWKATAKARRLTIREFTSEDERRVTIVLDESIIEESQVERSEAAITTAASLVSHFNNEGAEFRLFIGEKAGPFGTGIEHLHASLRRLALIAKAGQKRTANTPENQPPSPYNSSGFVILITTAKMGSIPAGVWRNSHVIHV
jgi:uncharacterized protein (DUF58 family)